MRYFSCTIQNGFVYLHYVAGQMSYRAAVEVDAAYNELRDRRIHSVEELDETLRESVGRPLPFGMIYVRDDLCDRGTRRRSPDCIVLDEHLSGGLVKSRHQRTEVRRPQSFSERRRAPYVGEQEAALNLDPASTGLHVLEATTAALGINVLPRRIAE